MYINLFMIIVRKDNRGLHDFVAGTKVKYIGYEEKKREAKIEEEQAVLISEKEIKTKKSKEDKIILNKQIATMHLLTNFIIITIL